MKQLTVTTIARTFLAAAAFAVLAIPAASRAAGTLKSVGCAAESGLRSSNSKQRAELTFINNTGQKLETYWLNYQGKRVRFADIGPGQSHTLNTFVTNPWVITNASGKCMAVYLPTPGSATAVIQ